MLILTDDFPRDLGYVLIDHRACGLRDLPPGVNARLVEEHAYTCSHCQYVVVKNANRTRERVKCGKCNHHICDGCAAKLAAGEPCRPFNQVVDELREKAARQVDSPIILLP